MAAELTEALLSQAAGWEAMKRARAFLQQDQVLSSNWTSPLLKGVVQSGEMSFRAGLVIKGPIDIENICTCRDSREWGKICAHSVAVGLHWIRHNAPAVAAPSTGAGGSRPRIPGSSAAAAPLRQASSLPRGPSGTAAELYLILPPNLEDAAGRGRIMVVLEASWSGGRCPLNVLPKDRLWTFSEQDNAVLDRFEEVAPGETPALLQLAAKDFVSLLPALAGHPRITLGKSTPVSVNRNALALPLRATLQANGEIVVALGQVARRPVLLADGWVWQEQQRCLQPLAWPPGWGDIWRNPIRVARQQVPVFLNQHWPSLVAAGAEADFHLHDFSLEPRPPRFLLELKGGLAQLSALLQCAYGARIMTLGVTATEEMVWLPDPEVATRYATRDAVAEQGAVGRLQRIGFTGPDRQGRWQLNGQNAVLNFFARELPRMQREWAVTLEERLERSTAQNLERIEPQFQISSSGVQWFDLGMVFAADSGEKFSAAEIQRLILSGQGHVRLRNGRTALLDTSAVEELQQVLLDCAPQQQGAGYRVAATQAGFLEATLRQQPGWKVVAPAAWRERAARQAGELKLDCPPLGHLDDVLRPYQKQGVAWLRFLRDHGFGGILADEMGLGKTLQTLALFHSLRAVDGAQRPESGGRIPHLVVCPTSLVFNWVAEAAKFTQTLKVLALQGPERHELFGRIPDSDLVVTSYALIRRDAEQYRGLEFDTVVLDEAQHIKNRQTQNAQAVKSVRCRHRLVLTGTPLENSVLDLWSIFDFLMPGYLGAAQDFRERYELPITRERNVEAQARLGRRLRPFLLRRLKREVAADLPAKLEQVSFCELTPDQRSVYQQVIEASRKEVLEAVGAQGLARSRMVVLNALLRLRQICCDLRLLKLDQAQIDPAAASGKVELFSELLEEILDGGHRVLVFSQFVSMLALLKERLTAEGVAFCYLDGSTTDRAAVVQRFQQDAGVPVFLISLKAGGVGLNLTGADTVVHFDPWWNPAVEDQATDRAHRLGQTRVVTSYKLITRDTVEEKILALQQRKREVIQATLGEEELTEALSWEDIQELLTS
jgi:superfamily II DNA or RNA helicase